MTSTNNRRLHPDLLSSVDCTVIVGQTSDDDLGNENEAIVETAKANQVQVNKINLITSILRAQRRPSLILVAFYKSRY